MNQKHNMLDQIIDSKIPYHQLSKEERLTIAHHGWNEAIYNAALELKFAADAEALLAAPSSLEQKIMASFDNRQKHLQRIQKIKERMTWACIGVLIGGLTVWHFKPKPKTLIIPVIKTIVQNDTIWQRDTLYLTKTVYRSIPSPSVQQDTIHQALEYTMESSSAPQNLFNQPEILQFLQVRNKLPKQ